jgi:hypothetical protein
MVFIHIFHRTEIREGYRNRVASDLILATSFLEQPPLSAPSIG